MVIMICSQMQGMFSAHVHASIIFCYKVNVMKHKTIKVRDLQSFQIADVHHHGFVKRPTMVLVIGESLEN